MPLNPNVLSLLQTAGQSLYDADRALQATTSEYADNIRLAMSSNPFDMGNDARFEEWKTIARLSKAVAQIEDELKKVYGAANALTSQVSLPRATPAALALPAFDVPAQHQVLKPIEATDVVDKRQRRQPAMKEKTTSKTRKKSKAATRPLRGNTLKLLEALHTRLSDAEHSKINRSSLAVEIGLPKGSIGASIIKLLEMGHIVEDEQGALRLSHKV